MARPSKYKDEYAAIAKKLCDIHGSTDDDLALFFDVSRSTISLWKLQHREFSDALKAGKEATDERVKRALVHRALGYSHPEDDIRVVEGKIVITPTVKNYPPDVTACIFWLKNRDPENFRASPDVSGGGDLSDSIQKLIDRLPN